MSQSIDEIFEATVRAGWRPKSPAFEPELEQLEAARVRGTCISPLAQNGDVLFVDPRLSPQSGDLVLFALSDRAARAHNEHAPPGGRTWEKGNLWAKLFVRYRDFAMLLDNAGSATATFLACEHPDDTPILRPIRNILRGHQLVYTPDAFADNIVANAATSLSSVSQTFAGGTTFGIGTNQVGTGVSFTIPSVSSIAGVEITVSCDIAADGGPDSGVYFVAFVSGNLSAGSTQALWQGDGGTRGMVTGTAQITGLAAGTYTAALFCVNTPGTANIKCWGYTISVDLIKR